MKYQIKTITMSTATQLRNDIKKAKRKLTNKAIKSGLWENFGQDEIMKIEYKYDKNHLSYGSNEERAMAYEIEAFERWCTNFDDADLRMAKGQI